MKTTSGVVRGRTLHVLNKTVNQYLNIPYAEPPIGNLRFAPPVPLKQPLNYVINDTKRGKACVQVGGNIAVSEDCLVLNIWTPNARNNNTNKSHLKPVMFWIYGGALVFGSINTYNGSFLAAHDVVFVAANYRLGQLGFLYGDREDAPGNVGFYDQLLALKWVRENIHLFGGDRNQITIFGESAGSWSVSAHILSPLSKGLFKRAIMQSGWSVSAHILSPLSKGLFKRAIMQSGSVFLGKLMETITKSEALVMAKNTAKQLNCSECKDWLQCLRGVDAIEFLKIQPEFMLPVIDKSFALISAQKAFQSKQFYSDIDLMVGVTRDEGSLLTEWFMGHIHNITVDRFKQCVNKSETLGVRGIDVDKVTDFYLKGVNTTDETALQWAFYRYAGDVLMNCPTYLFGQQFARNVAQNDGNVYFYEFTYANSDMSQVIGCDQETMGICHAIDIFYVFGIPYLMPAFFTAEDFVFSLSYYDCVLSKQTGQQLAKFN
ncbi:unnamed protein product [Medioppia subpectinata]|uniref:Carboxylic ester hydrolase n=1 Tax=Medioppia subpectinata TaxID=1979941 RepID=A0A7R9Q5V9_9ACAR|nr:unnamed protein product [Medioppia subpectinata]CAG2114150.1 unnamed protein product [Medioppia subpectinata]